MHKLGCRIKSVGSYFPEEVVPNKALISAGVDTTDEWVQDKLGIKQRHIAKGPFETVSYMGHMAAVRALDNASMVVDDVDLIICVTSSPERISPSTACLIQEKLKPVRLIPSFDINAVCTGFLYAMEVATSLLHKYENILIVCAESYSKWTDWTDRNCVFFGDAAAAVIVTGSDVGWYHGHVFADGTGKDNFTIHHGHTFSMNGPQVYKVGTQVLPQSITGVLKSLDMSIEEVDYFVPHQPSHLILKKTADIIGLPHEKIMMNMDMRGNTAGASIPTVLGSLYEKKVLKNNDIILFAAVGSGWTWGAGVLKWCSDE